MTSPCYMLGGCMLSLNDVPHSPAVVVMMTHQLCCRVYQARPDHSYTSYISAEQAATALHSMAGHLQPAHIPGWCCSTGTLTEELSDWACIPSTGGQLHDNRVQDNVSPVLVIVGVV